MENQLKLKIKIGQVEFEAEGDANAVTEQRDVFIQNIVPAASAFLDKIQNLETAKIIEPTTNHKLLQNNLENSPLSAANTTNDWERTSLTSFLNKFGELSERDFVLFSAFYHEQKQPDNKYVFTVDDVKNYYSEARRNPYSNYSQLLTMLVKAGLILDALNAENTSPKPYLISQEGLSYVNSYKPKEKSEKKIKKPSVSRKRIESIYSSLNADDLNLSKYPLVKDLKQSKEQVILAMYIITQENKGDWFKNSDIEYIMPNLFDVHITKDQVSNVFRQKSWFDSKSAEDEPKSLTHRLLSQAKDFAQKIISENSNANN